MLDLFVFSAIASLLTQVGDGITWVLRRSRVSAWLLALPWLVLVAGAIGAGAGKAAFEPSAQTVVISGLALYALVMIGDALTLAVHGRLSLVRTWHVCSRSVATGTAFGVAAASAIDAPLSVPVIALACGAAIAGAARTFLADYAEFLRHCLRRLSEKERFELDIGVVEARAMATSVGPVVASQYLLIRHAFQTDSFLSNAWMAGAEVALLAVGSAMLYLVSSNEATVRGWLEPTHPLSMRRSTSKATAKPGPS